jgi:hypothetical protein
MEFIGTINAYLDKVLSFVLLMVFFMTCGCGG